MRRFVSLIALATVAAAAAVLPAACTKVSTANGPSARAGVLRIAVQTEPKDLNPILQSDTTDNMIDRLLFEPLVSADARGNPVPILATEVPTRENGGISKDGLTITYHLRKDAYWTDGVPVTSADVKFTWEAVMNPANDVVSRHGYDLVTRVDTPDDHTVVFHLKQKFAPAVDTLFAESDSPIEIIPAHVLQRYPNLNQVPFDSEPMVSDGPFRFARWIHGDRIILERNDRFFLGRPKLKQIVIRVIPDENTAVNELRIHDIDWMFEASIDTYPLVRSIPGTRIVWVGINGYERMQMNTQRPPLNDPVVRRAIAYAIDKKRLAQLLTYGQEPVATEDIPDWMWAYDPQLPVYPYDPAKARDLLRSRGWTPGPDGIMQRDGRRFSLVVVTNNSNATRRQLIVQVQAMLRSAGIDAQVKFFPGDVLFAPAGMGGILQGGKFDLALDGWYAGLDPDDSSQFTCANVAPKGYDYSRFCDPAMDTAERGALEHYDRSARKRAYAVTQRILAREVPEIYFWWYRQMQPISTAFEGFDPNPVTESWNAWQWSI
jgi:peptide/nickel transport system substrate-binding protein